MTSLLLLAQFSGPPDVQQWARQVLGDYMVDHHLFYVDLWQWLGLAIIIALAISLGEVLQRVLIWGGTLVSSHTKTKWDEAVVKILPGPLRSISTLILIEAANPALHLGESPQYLLDLILRSLLIISLTWLALRAITLGSEVLEDYLAGDIGEGARRRAIHTQIAVPRGILRFLVVLLGGSLVLLQFEVVRNIGVSLLASAGLAGVVVGFAAQRTVANLLAGIQLAIFQPIKIGDSVVVEGEWGWVEEIGLTYVVIKIWDLRRLILPVSYFLDKPFQNWTKTSPELLGTVYLYADYTISVDAVRAELKRIVKKSDLWDGKAQGIVVTNLTDRTVELRALVSASDGGKVWELRCLVREKLLAWLQSKGKDHLPTYRVEMEPLDGEQTQSQGVVSSS